MTLYFDCSYGAAGDMLVGALIDLGADFKIIKEKLKNIEGVSGISIKKIEKSGISATKFNVKFDSDYEEYLVLIEKIEKLNLNSNIEVMSKKILKKLAAAESAAHKVKIEDVHLHEAADCIIDAVAFSVALNNLKKKFNFQSIYCSTVSVGVLAPATQNIIHSNKIPIKKISDAEITTPTGAAILSAAVDKFINDSDKNLKKYKIVGYGAGDMDFDYPNVLKVFV